MNIKNKIKFILKLQNTIKATLKKEVSAKEKGFLKEGSVGIYTDELIPLLLQLPGNSQELFWILVEARDEWNQIHKSRKEMGSIYMKNYYKTNFSTDINRLIASYKLLSGLIFLVTMVCFSEKTRLKNSDIM